MKTRIFRRRDDTMRQIAARLPAIEATYGSLRNADPVATSERLQRMRYGTWIARPDSAD